VKEVATNSNKTTPRSRRNTRTKRARTVRTIAIEEEEAMVVIVEESRIIRADGTPMIVNLTTARDGEIVTAVPSIA